MNKEQSLNRFREMMNAPPLPPLGAAASFLSSFFADDSWNEAQERIDKLVQMNSRTITSGLEAIERLIESDSIEEGQLSHLVAWEANQVLDDPSDEGAREWLREVAEMIREAMGDKAPPRVSEQVHA